MAHDGLRRTGITAAVRRRRVTPALAVVAAAVGVLGAGCGGGSSSTEPSGPAPLSQAISRYTGLSRAEADAVASSVGSTSPEALTALTQAVADQPPLPSSASVASDLGRIGRERGFDAEAALADLCTAILSVPSPDPSIRLDPASDELEVRWPVTDPARRLGLAVHRAAVLILGRKFSGPHYTATFLEQFEDVLVTAATSGVEERSDANQLLLWLRLEQLRAGACG
jgi:hypothetical protein